jgi:hypothetical protein
MTGLPSTCPTCLVPLRTVTLPAGQGRSGPVSTTVDPRSATVCPSGCTTTAGAPSTRRIDDAVEQRMTFGTGRTRSVRCGACAAVLDLPMRATTRSVTVEPVDGPPFTVTFTLPVVRCGGCGTDNVPPELRDHVRLSIRVACGEPSDVVARTGLGRLLLTWRRRLGGQGSPGRPSRP